LAKTRRKRLAPREPNGRPQRKPSREAEEDAKIVVLAARGRVFGLSREQSDRVEAGSLMGRLYLGEYIVLHQLQAAMRYEEIVQAANRAILAKGYPSPGDLNRSRGGHDSDDGTSPEYVAKCRAATEAANRAWRCLRDCGEALARYALDQAIADDHVMALALARSNPIMVPEIRIGCNALARMLKIQTPVGR